MSVIFAESFEALTILSREDFQSHWRQLHASCPWATAFQGADFALTWYRCYGEQFEPAVLYEFAADGRLVGLLTLARRRGSDRLVAAGSHQAEYQCWLALPDSSDTFFEAAIRLLHRGRRHRSLFLRYLPANIPLGCARRSKRAPPLIQLRAHRCPLVELGRADTPAVSLKKSGNRSQFNRLKRLGDVRLCEITSADALNAIFDEIADHYDLRQGSMTGGMPFRDDPTKREFHIELMRRPGVLHVTTLVAGDVLLAALIGVRSGATLSIAVSSYSPIHGRQSPGKYLLLLLSQRLIEQGYGLLDLTPSGDWKDRFANRFDDVHELTVHFSRSTALRTFAVATTTSILKRALSRFGIEPADVRSLAARLIHPGSAGLAAACWSQRQVFVYAIDASEVVAAGEREPMTRDCLADLLSYPAEEPRRRRKAFLSRSLSYLERGRHAFTLVEGGRLVRAGWLVERQDRLTIEGVRQDWPLPPHSAVLYDDFAHPSARRPDLTREMFRQMLRAAADVAHTKRVYTAIPAADAALRAAVEELGFRRQVTFHRSSRFGRVLEWASEG